MFKKLAKIKYLPNNFEIIEEGDHVVCAISGKKIPLDQLNYWNVDYQRLIFSILKHQLKRKRIIIISICHGSKSIVQDFLKSFFLKFYLAQEIFD